MAQIKKILVSLEIYHGTIVRASFEAVSAALQIAKETKATVVGVIFGRATEREVSLACKSGVQRIIVADCEGMTEVPFEICAEGISQIFKKENPDLIFFGGTDNGKDMAAWLAADLHTSAIPNARQLYVQNGDIISTIRGYSDSINIDLTVSGTTPGVVVTCPGAFQIRPFSELNNIVPEKIQISYNSVQTKVIKTVREIKEEVNLEDADVIVAGGRGMGNATNFSLLQELADALHGEIGATRPAIEAGWIGKNHQIGASGKSVAPKLYIAAGISGALQHLSGISDSTYLVAINIDEDAPIFSVADVGIVGDAKAILPLMTQKIRSMYKSIV